MQKAWRRAPVGPFRASPLPTLHSCRTAPVGHGGPGVPGASDGAPNVRGAAPRASSACQLFHQPAPHPGG
eukprot:7258140-Alexandrium_andersonii.AAC.1